MQKKKNSCILGDPKITKSNFFATYLPYNSKTKAQIKKRLGMEPPPKMTQKISKNHKKHIYKNIFQYIFSALRSKRTCMGKFVTNQILFLDLQLIDSWNKIFRATIAHENSMSYSSMCTYCYNELIPSGILLAQWQTKFF